MCFFSKTGARGLEITPRLVADASPLLADFVDLFLVKIDPLGIKCLTLICHEFPSRLGLNKLSYCIRSLKLECIFSGEGEKRSVFVGCKFLMGNLDVRRTIRKDDLQNPNSPARMRCNTSLSTTVKREL